MNVYFIKLENKRGQTTFSLVNHLTDPENLTSFTNGNGYYSQTERLHSLLDDEQREEMYSGDRCALTWLDLACAVWVESGDQITQSAQEWLKRNDYAPADAIIPDVEETRLELNAELWKRGYASVEYDTTESVR